MTAGNRELRGTATVILCGAIVDQAGEENLVRFPALIISGLRRHMFSPPAAIKRGVTTNNALEEGKPHLCKSDAVISRMRTPRPPNIEPTGPWSWYTQTS